MAETVWPTNICYLTLYRKDLLTFGSEGFQWIGGGKSLIVVGFNVKWKEKN